MTALLWIPLLAVLGFIIERSVRAVLDHRRIRDYFESRGGTVLDITWAPFRSSRPERNREDVYLVTLQDRDGITQTVYCKSSFMEGVFLADLSDEPLEMKLRKPETSRHLRD